jgi:hypothetical protein
VGGQRDCGIQSHRHLRKADLLKYLRLEIEKVERHRWIDVDVQMGRERFGPPEDITLSEVIMKFADADSTIEIRVIHRRLPVRLPRAGATVLMETLNPYVRATSGFCGGVKT